MRESNLRPVDLGCNALTNQPCDPLFFFFSEPGVTLLGSFRGNIALNCNHYHGDQRHVKWTYHDKYNDDAFEEVIAQNGWPGTPTYGTNFTAERIRSWDFTTGNLVIDDLGCWDDQLFYCNISSANDSEVFMPITAHRLVLGES